MLITIGEHTINTEQITRIRDHDGAISLMTTEPDSYAINLAGRDATALRLFLRREARNLLAELDLCERASSEAAITF